MSREQPCLGEASPPASSSKNAKDKNNSTTVEALHDCKHKEESNGRSCSEKDSGFSDNSSDSKHLDEKDECNKKQQREAKEESCHNEPRKKSNRRNVIVSPKTQELQSFYIIKNSVQPDIVQKKKSQVLWSSGAMPSVSGSNPIILLQPSPSPQFSKSQGKSKNEGTTKKTNAANAPGISYPRIAPRPHKKTTSNGESLNQSKRVCIESNNIQVNTNSQDTHKVDPSASQPSTSIASVSSTQSSSTATTSSTSELNKNSVINTRHRRFFNTVQVLKKSGLWDMSLRTKELMRQSNATKRDIAELRQHSDLLCQLTSGSNNQMASSNQSKATLFDLHKDMVESGSYPGLKDIKDLQVQNVQQDGSVEKPLRVKNGDGDNDDDDDKESPVVSDAANVTSDPTPEQTSKSTEDPKTSNDEQSKKTNPSGSSDD